MFLVLRISDADLLNSHIKEWEKFWSDWKIEVDGDDELVKKLFALKLPRLAVNNFSLAFAVPYDNFEHILHRIEFAINEL